MVFMASLHVGGGVCASGKSALAAISTMSTSGPFSAGRTVVLPRDFLGSGGCEIRDFIFFPIALRLDGHHGSSSAELPVRFWGDMINIHVWSRGSRDPRDLAVGFLAAQLTGAQNNLLEYIACNIYVYVYIYMCKCMYMWVYVHVCTYICIYANNLNDPRHCFVIGSSSLFCMDVCDHIINVFPVHSLNKRFLILILILIPCLHTLNAWLRSHYEYIIMLVFLLNAITHPCHTSTLF